jgi:hypothetical protein
MSTSRWIGIRVACYVVIATVIAAVLSRLIYDRWMSWWLLFACPCPVIVAGERFRDWRRLRRGIPFGPCGYKPFKTPHLMKDVWRNVGIIVLVSSLGSLVVIVFFESPFSYGGEMTPLLYLCLVLILSLAVNDFMVSYWMFKQNTVIKNDDR